MGMLQCNGCTACCRDQLVVICEEIDGDPAQWDTVTIAEAGEAGALANEMMLGMGELSILRQIDGACVYLGEGGCTIYERRPAMCRSFDCRKMALDVLSGKLHGDPFHPCIKEGVARLGTL